MSIGRPPSERQFARSIRRYAEKAKMNAAGFYIMMFALPLAIIATALLLFYLTGRKPK